MRLPENYRRVAETFYRPADSTAFEEDSFEYEFAWNVIKNFPTSRMFVY